MKKSKIAASVFLTAVMIFSAVVPIFAAEKKCNCGHAPVLSISGINSTPLYDANGKTVFAPESEDIVKTVLEVLPYFSAYLINKDVDALLDGFLPAANKLFAPIACGPDGKPADPGVHIEGYDPNKLSDLSYENNKGAFNDALVKVVGEDHVYQYAYDWRRGPFEIADDINTIIQNIKAETGHDKVALDGQSMGACMVQAYLAVYGTKDVETVGMVSPAFTGVEMVTQLFKGNIEISADLMTDMLIQAIHGSADYDSLLKQIPVIEAVLNELQPIIDKGSERFFKEFAIPVFGYNPGMWTFVSPDSFDEAYDFILADADESLKEEIVRYHELVQLPMKQRVNDLEASKDINYFCVSHYNRVMIPVTSAGNWQGDSVIETAHTSGFATVAKRGETLGDNYVQANNCHKNHISPDNIIDASTCFTPESTWFIKNANHVGVTDGNAEFFVWLMTSKEQCSVYSNPLYPQFMYYNTDNDYLAPYLYSFGDVDLNGNINLVDVRLALRQSLGRETLAKLSLCQADFDIDGTVTKDEAIKIMEIA